MSFTDFAQSLHNRATDLMCGRPMVFHHVPKCGGTSVGRSIRRAYLLSQGTVTPVESEKAFDAAKQRAKGSVGHVSELREMMLLYMLFSDVRCVSAHIPFSDAAFDAFGDRYAFITILRDPVDRFISNYFWSHDRPDAHYRIAEPLEDFLSTDRARAVGSTYARYFCGEPGHIFGTAQVDAAVRNLHRMSFVGFLDQIDDFEAALHRLTGRRIRIGKENIRGTGSKRDAILSGPLRDKILEVCAADREIWNGVQDLRARQSAPASERPPEQSVMLRTEAASGPT